MNKCCRATIDLQQSSNFRKDSVLANEVTKDAEPYLGATA